MEWIVILGLAVVALVRVAQHQVAKSLAKHDAASRAAKREWLSSKYADDPFLKDILAGNIRQGMTKQQVLHA